MLLSLFAVLVSITLSAEAQTSERPNILIILNDDMGHGDLSINGSKTPTSNIDRIIKEGVSFLILWLDIKRDKPKAKRKIIAIDITSEDDLKKQTLKILKKDFTNLADYYFEYDSKVDSKSELSYCYFSSIRGTNPVYNDKMGVDTTGKLVQSPTKFDNKWKWGSVGLGTYSPPNFSDLGLTFKFDKLGKTTVYLDNIRIKNLKGEVVYEFFQEDFENVKITSTKATIRN